MRWSVLPATGGGDEGIGCLTSVVFLTSLYFQAVSIYPLGARREYDSTTETGLQGVWGAVAHRAVGWNSFVFLLYLIVVQCFRRIKGCCSCANKIITQDVGEKAVLSQDSVSRCTQLCQPWEETTLVSILCWYNGEKKIYRWLNIHLSIHSVLIHMIFHNRDSEVQRHLLHLQDGSSHIRRQREKVACCPSVCHLMSQHKFHQTFDVC